MREILFCCFEIDLFDSVLKNYIGNENKIKYLYIKRFILIYVFVFFRYWIFINVLLYNIRIKILCMLFIGLIIFLEYCWGDVVNNIVIIWVVVMK